VRTERAWRAATRGTAWVVGGLFLVLLATGIALTFRYRPTVTSVGSLETSSPITLRNVHRLASTLFIGSVGALAIASIGLFVIRRDRLPIAIPVAAAGVTVGAGITGYLLPWDQLGLWAVTVGGNFEGYTQIIRGDKVKFVLVGSREFSTSTFSHWYWLHALVVPLVFVALFAALVGRVHGRRGTAT
jgi:quinol-cytochrome oxidoreductase complex cytochrome b subunit